MSVRIIKKGLLDTIQDNGRYGHQHLGINPGGAMDRVAASVANMLAGNEIGEAVIEMHFPAASFLFESAATIAFSGADFAAMINGQPVPVNTMINVSENAVLEFSAYKKGARSYLAVHGGWEAEKWLGSYSTNLKVNVGGQNGSALKKDDVLVFKKPQHISGERTTGFVLPGIVADTNSFYDSSFIRCVKGNAFEQLSDASKVQFGAAAFSITAQSDRMGYRLQGEALSRTVNTEMLSSAVTRGTIQLLPSGQLIVLMADHQTTGGYPVVAHVISADLPAMAQKRANEKICFRFVSLEEAEQALYEQQQQLALLRRTLFTK